MVVKAFSLNTLDEQALKFNFRIRILKTIYRPSWKNMNMEYGIWVSYIYGTFGWGL